MKVSVILYDHKELSNGEYPLMLRISHKKQRKLKSLGISLPKSKWNSEKGRLKGVKARSKGDPKYKDYEDYLNLKNLIAEKEKAFNDEISSIASQGIAVTIDQLIKRVENPVKETTLFIYFSECISKYRNENNLGMARVLTMTLKSIKNFNSDIDMRISQIDLIYLNGYEEWLKKKGLKDTTISIYFRTLRMMLNKAIGEGYMKQSDYPFGKKNENSKFNISKFKVTTRKRAIQESEIKLIEEAELSDELEMAREYFLCSYYMAGINFNDMCKLTWKNLKDNRIKYIRTKTGTQITTMLLPYPKAVINKYRLKTGIDDKNYIFPVLNRHIHKTPQQIANRIHKVLGQLNKALKDIAKQVGIKDNLTTYVARHSFITHMANSGKVTPFELKNIVGHVDLKTTMVYYKEADQKKQDELMQKVFISK